VTTTAGDRELGAFDAVGAGELPLPQPATTIRAARRARTLRARIEEIVRRRR